MLRRFTSWLSKQMQANRAVGSPIAPVYDAMISERVRRDFEPEVLRDMGIDYV